jgi:hypothetical protein
MNHHLVEVRTIFSDAYSLSSDRMGRDIARRIESLPGIPKGRGQGHLAGAQCAITPVVACLDPRRRFPVLNAAQHVKQLLGQLDISGKSLADKYDALVALIGQKGIQDSFMIDVLGPDVRLFRPRKKPLSTQKDSKPHASFREQKRSRPLAERDAAEVKVIGRTLSYIMKRTHDKMTNALKQLLEGRYELEQGTERNMFDALVRAYRPGRDLLVEAKSSSDMGCLRLAVGQLLDYRRKVPNPPGTDVAVLLPEKPPRDAIKYLRYLGIAAIWFNARMDRLMGDWRSHPTPARSEA